MDLAKFRASEYHGKISELVSKANSIRLDAERPTDVTFAELIEDETGLTVDEFYDTIGVDPAFDTIQNIFTTPDNDIRWLVPEIIRDALRLGYRSAPIWPMLTAIEEQTSGLQQILPHLNMSAATPKRVGEGETIPLGDISYGSKPFRIYKYGRGIKISDEVIRYVSLNILSVVSLASFMALCFSAFAFSRSSLLFCAFIIMILISLGYAGAKANKKKKNQKVK